MSRFESLVLPLLITLAVHVAAAFLLFFSWQGPAPVAAKLPDAPVMQARLVSLTQTAPTPKPAAAPRPRPAPQAQQRPQPPKPTPAPKPAPTKPVERPAPKPAVAAKPAPPAPAAKASDLDALLAQELQQEGAPGEEATASYIGAIQRALEQNWSRPPSASRNMEATVVIRLLPNGELVGTAVVVSSGNPAFDRSVEQAVQRAAPFTNEIRDMPAALFEQYFRQGIRLVFRPEDLRI